MRQAGHRQSRGGAGPGLSIVSQPSDTGGRPIYQATNGLTAAVVNTWFMGPDPWPCKTPAQLALLRRLEEQFAPLESEETETKVGIGVATGNDQVFITTDSTVVEDSRLRSSPS